MRIIAGLDLETTGLNWTEGHRIVEVCVQLHDLADQRRLASWTQRVNPERPIDPGAQAVHGISFEALAGEPRWEEVAPKLHRILERVDVVVAHNGAGFDMPFTRHELMRVGLSYPERPIVDTMLQGTWATYLGKRPNLGELCAACGMGYEPEKAHAAEYDVLKMMECFFIGYGQRAFTIPSCGS